MPKGKTARTATQTLLVELLTEELPPKALYQLSQNLANHIQTALLERGLIDESAMHDGTNSLTAFATPRRLAVQISNVRELSPETQREVQGPPVTAPAQAVNGFAKKNGIAVDALEKRQTPKGEMFVARVKSGGVTLDTILAGTVEAALRALPIPKAMRWGSGDTQFVRPVHGVILLHGGKVIPGTVLGIKSGNKTLGHRFLSKGVVTIKRADDYEKTLEKQGEVVPSFEKRRALIVKGLDQAAAKFGNNAAWRLGHAEELIDEVTSIVENPCVYTGTFDQSFLEVPRECLIVSMQGHQRYFPIAVMDKPRTLPPGYPPLEGAPPKGKLLPNFLFVANMHPADASQIVHGNERVLRARLSDAKFFYDQDRKTKLAERVPQLANVVYQNKLGSQLERVQRITKLAGEIARRVNATVERAERAAYLSKADLLTGMVAEFPELQGIMGSYYAEHDGEHHTIADAIREHYQPRYAGDTLPMNAVSISVALADKLDTLVGIYGIGLIPTGDKDPFGLRRQALGTVRILIERAQMLPSLDIQELLKLTEGNYASGVLAENVAQRLYEFLLDRLRPYLRDRGYAPDEIEAVLALNPTRFDQVVPRLDAVKNFRRLPEGQSLAAANKRISNILRQAFGDEARSDSYLWKPELLHEPAEQELGRRLLVLRNEVPPLFALQQYTQGLQRLAELKPAVDAFFDKVMVMSDDQAIRNNRLSMLSDLRGLFLWVADISRLQG